MRAIWTSYDSVSFNYSSKWLPVGGVLKIELFQLPLTAKVAKQWKLRMLYNIDETLAQLNYPTGETGPMSYANAAPLKVQYQLPN